MLHVITDDRILVHPDFIRQASELAAALEARVTLHLRGHRLPAALLFEIAQTLARSPYGTPLLINDRIDIAAAVHAAGVQLGARSLAIRAARRLLGDAARIGYSAHSPAEAVRAEMEGANFILLGTIYASASHPEAAPAGIDVIQRTVDACGLPIVAIGGVTAQRVPELRAAGVSGVAVIRAVWETPDPVQAARDLVTMLES